MKFFEIAVTSEQGTVGDITGVLDDVKAEIQSGYSSGGGSLETGGHYSWTLFDAPTFEIPTGD